MSGFLPTGFGWNRDLPDYRDYTPHTPVVRELLAGLAGDEEDWDRPSSADLREFFPPVRDQGPLHSSVAIACASTVEYFERRAAGRFQPLSALFVYKAARLQTRTTGDSGTGIRSAIKALIRYGAPHERLWPYEVSRCDAVPDAHLYAYRDEYRSLCYARLDGRDGNGRQTLARVRSLLDSGIPTIFGFPVPGSISSGADVPYRPTLDSPLGGQAVVAVGYDDRRLQSTRGALLIRSSWGAGWGDEGYGWLPYAYVEEQLAADFWILLKREWMASGEFRRTGLTMT